jgi:hypothetical protein
MAKLPKPKVGPTMTWEQLRVLTDGSLPDGREKHGDLPASLDNARWVSEHRNDSDPPPHFPNGREENLKLKKAIVQAFRDCKGIDPTDPNPRWLLAWRMYPNANHPDWQGGGMDSCGCNCGCMAPRTYWP